MLLEKPTIRAEEYSPFPRLSNIWQDKYWHWKHAYEPQARELSAADQLRMELGHKIEDMTIDYLNEIYGITVTDRQATVETPYYFELFGETKQLTGHIDGIIKVPYEIAIMLGADKEFTGVFECKSTAYFRQKDIENDMPDYYTIQAQLYAHYLGLERIVYCFVDRGTCERHLVYKPLDKELIAKQEARIKMLIDTLKSNVEPSLEFPNTKIASGTKIRNKEQYKLDGIVNVLPHPNNKWCPYIHDESYFDESLVDKIVDTKELPC